ncbi:hypothetical protein ACFFQW_08270 [Umezawaea endophytica]|uniref:Nucleotidyltransferase-like protein n=1 Tax=Umezawaea endophytica TaxID=1654476 RepID=A0A9X2ZY16_9PSEU|nr:hypothetical protein [Umezawaea endophytica]MCS7475979.1 hypothetical protein [Umezawaea endophytica]
MDLLVRQEQLQREAERVVGDLDLMALLGRIGRVQVIGSAASGLMVWRDLDISVYTSAGRGEVADVVRELVAHPEVVDLHFVGPHTPSGLAKDWRYYAVVHYRDWKIDLSLWTSTGPSGGFSDAVALRDRLDDETRLAILTIKDHWCRLDEYPDVVSGVDVYDAVLNHGVRTVDEFRARLG